MYEVKTQAAQGDLLITRIDALPDDLTPVKPDNDVYILAHSETGHHHTVEQSNVSLFRPANDEFVAYMVVELPTVLRHERAFDTHAPLSIPPGTYRINRQREYTPEGFRRAVD